jgi:hypothetical protein
MGRARFVILAAYSALAGCSAEHGLEAEAKAAVLRELKDPESAKFDDQLMRAYIADGLVCGGRVNSKNGMGGFTGFQSFWYSKSDGVVLDEAPASDVTIRVIKACTAATEAAAR